MSVRVQDHYGASDIVARILAAARQTSVDSPALSADRFFPHDQLHGRELLATIDHAAKLNPAKEAHLLDVGSGIGGPARYFASVFGCDVTGVDLTPQFVAAATDLTRLAGLSEKVDFIEGDVAEMPFGSAAFDHVYCFYVGMNLPDKPAVLRECFRVLRPGGSLLWTEVTSKDGDPHYPLPWAREPEGSHVGTEKTLVGQVRDAGFDIRSVDDETASHLELVKRIKAAGGKPTEVHNQVNEVVLGPDFAERRTNYIQGLADGALSSTVIYARKPGRPQ